MDHLSQWTAHSSANQSAASSSSFPPDAALTSSPNHRTTGLPPAVSSSSLALARLSDVTISSSNTNNPYSSSCYDASSLLNPSASSSTSINRNSVQSSEPSVPHSPHHVLINQPRLRTSNQVFTSTTDLAAHHGIPTQFPPLPSIQTRRPVPVTQPQSVSAFDALKANYLSMLSQKPESTPSAAPDMSSATVSPADLQQPLVGDFGGDLEGLLRSLGNSPLSSPPLLEAYPSPIAQGTTAADMSPFEPNDFLTSPWTPSLDTFEESPLETPLTDFLSTPLLSDDLLTEPLFDSESPFFQALGDTFESTSSSKPVLSIDASELLTFSPTSPTMGTPALNPSHLISPAMTLENAFPAPPAPATPSLASPAIKDVSDASRRRVSATGTRKNITVDSLVPLEAPTQPRRYLTASATSRKEMPAVFARKRQRAQMLDGDEDELEISEPLKPNATEAEQIEWKRRQNTLAARKSRKRKLQHQQELESQVSGLKEEREKWRQRALTLQGILQANGIPFGDFGD